MGGGWSQQVQAAQDCSGSSGRTNSQPPKHECTVLFAQVLFELVDRLEIGRELLFIEKNSPLAYDGWLADASTVVDLVTNTGLVAPIDSFIALDDSNIHWSDVTE
jgi:hypothetical protein